MVRNTAAGVTDDLGALIAWRAFEDGTPMYDREGKRIGVVEHVMAYGGIFEGIVVHTHPLPGRHLYADDGQIAEIRELGVLLRVPRSELYEPAGRRSSRGARERSLEARLRRAWDWLMDAH